MRNDGNAWAAKLRQYSELPPDDEAHLDALIAEPQHYEAKADIISEGEKPTHIHVVVSGFACRYKLLADGRRQITAYLVPGDMCDLYVFLLKEMDHSVAALESSRVAAVPRDAILRISDERPRLARALWWATLVDEAVLRQWVVNVGRRTAYERVAHVLWELFLRMRVIGAVNGQSFDLPLTQQEIADTLGLSIVHVNRTLQRLREEGILRSSGRRLTVLDAHRLKAISGFDPTYLHMKDVSAA